MNNQNTINDIRSKIDIVELIGEYAPLEQKGSHFWGSCPFHKDKSPSLMVDPQKQTFNCWSCHRSGNVFNFYQEIENVDFKEALKALGERVGVSLTGGISSFDSRYSKYYEIYDLSSKFYQLMLNTDSGKEAKEYLKKRGIDDETIKEFGIGLAPNEKNKLVSYLQKKNYDSNTLSDLWLLNGEVDTFINRIMFPLDDRNGRVVGFSGRIYTESNFSKYMNTKETPIFKKGSCLYHYKSSKEYVRIEKSVIIMEGFMDVIRASTIGVKNTVALMGTALTDEQIVLLKKLSLNVYLCLDGDKPGLDAALHNGETLEKAGFNVKVIYLKDDEDPDSYILKYGKEKFISLIENALNYSDFKISRLKMDIDFSSPDELTKYIENVLKEISLVESEITREIMLKKLATETNVSYNTLEKNLNEYLNAKDSSYIKQQNFISKEENIRKDKYTRASLEFLYYMLINPKVIKVYDSKKLYFIDSNMRNLAGEISYYYHNYGDILIADFYTYLNDKKELLVVFEEVIKLSLDEEINDYVIDDYVRVISDYNVRQEIVRLRELMMKESDELEKAKIAEKIRLLRIEE
ncbi:MAG: DNA primase [Bacilli bacterium]|nr:DNA primase [Bacilli bacterium]